MQHLRGTLVHYPWGTFDTIHELLGSQPDGRPVAELWLGAHPLAPSTLVDTTLDVAVAQRPELLGAPSVAEFGPNLPFLMKVLSARHPLSLQAHPSREQAREGFAAEEAAGVPLTSPQRIYKDDWPKPEILVALTEFHALCGFRDPDRTFALFEALGAGPLVDRLVAPLRGRGGEVGLQEFFLEVLSMKERHVDVVDAVLAAAVPLRHERGELGAFAATALELDDVFPRDPGILAALLMNRITLAPGQGMYTDAGAMHAHLRGTGVEVMASSDNVLRGGLTAKHVSVDELVRVVDFGWGDPEVMDGVETSPGVWDYPTHCHEFDVWRLEVAPGASVAVPAPEGARIALVTQGTVTLASSVHTLELTRGASVFIPAGSPAITATGSGQVFLSAPGLG